MRTKTPTN